MDSQRLHAAHSVGLQFFSSATPPGESFAQAALSGRKTARLLGCGVDISCSNPTLKRRQTYLKAGNLRTASHASHKKVPPKVICDKLGYRSTWKFPHVFMKADTAQEASKAVDVALCP